MVHPGGAVLAGRYELLSLLATGGMGQVWRGRDAVLGRPVAVKVLRSEYTGDPTFLGRFRAEARHTARLAHRNIATLFDYGEVPAAEDTGEHLAYLVMELVEGESLSSLLAREGRLPVERTLDLLSQTAAALAAAHAAGVVHRDVKPGNVLVGDDGVVKITDFGIAWSASSVPLTQTGQVVGTAHYLSPEQANGEKAGPGSDVYALGAIGYECLAGRRPVEGDNSVQIALRHLTDVPLPLPVDVPDAVRSLIGRALLKDPVERYADGAAFRDAVADVLAGRSLPPLPAPAPSTIPLALAGRRRPVPVRRGRPRRLAVPAAMLVVGAAVGMVALELFDGPPAVTAVAAGIGGAPAGLPSSSAPSTAPPAAVSVDPSAYLGRSVADVQAELVARGLRVRATGSEVPGAAVGTVTSLDPSGLLAPGDEVVVGYALAAAVPVPHSSPAAQVAVVPAASSAAIAPVPGPAPVPAAPAAGAPAAGPRPGKGKPAGRGKGRETG